MILRTIPLGNTISYSFIDYEVFSFFSSARLSLQSNLRRDCLDEKPNNDLFLAFDAEEQWQGMSLHNERDVVSHNHHNSLLENLSNFHKLLIHSVVSLKYLAEETNWKQKFQNPQNENISLTNLNVENNRNFQILSFGRVIKIRLFFDKKEVCLVKNKLLQVKISSNLSERGQPIFKVVLIVFSFFDVGI